MKGSSCSRARARQASGKGSARAAQPSSPVRGLSGSWMAQWRNSICTTQAATEMLRCLSTSIPLLVA